MLQWWFYQNSAGHQRKTPKGFLRGKRCILFCPALTKVYFCIKQPHFLNHNSCSQVWCLQTVTLSCVTRWRDWTVVHVNNLSFLLHISWLFPKLKCCLKPLLSVSAQFLPIQWFINRLSASRVVYPPEVIEGTCTIQTSTNNPLSQEKKWINAAAQKMTWALARAHRHNNRDIQPRMLMTPLCLASRAALVFCKPGLHSRLAGCKHSRRYGRLKKSLLMCYKFLLERPGWPGSY